MSLQTVDIDQDTSERRTYNTVPIEPADIGFLRIPGDRPVAMRTIQTGSAGDPLVVTGSSVWKDERIEAVEALHQMRNYCAGNIMVEADWAIVGGEPWLGQELEASAIGDWRQYVGLLVSRPSDVPVVGIVDAPSVVATWRAVGEFLARRAIVDPIRFQRAFLEGLLKCVTAEYQMILGVVLESIGYEAQEIYEDGLGGFVVDFLKDRDRVTCVVSASSVQLLFVKKGAVETRLFERNVVGKMEFAQFVEKTFQ